MPVIIFSSSVVASNTIARSLLSIGGFEKTSETEWKLGETTLIDCKSQSILDIPTDFETDYIIVLSPHKSKDGKPALTAHFPGNWNEAKYGGEQKTINVAFASKLKDIIKEMHALAKNSQFEVTLEADHHGPTCSVPIIYAELGSSEKHWNNEEGAGIVARAVLSAIKSERVYEAVLGIGGGHYPKRFNEMVLNGELAVAHILPKYMIDSIGEDVFRQAVEKNVENVRKVVVLKDETSVGQRKKIAGLCEKFGVEYEEL
jgi:D-aminoacyl-tRNA deacylase